jgi:hypothetical protein
MKKHIVCIIVSIIAISFAGAQSISTEMLDEKLAGFQDEINKSLPDSATNGTSWSDAYIGSIIGVPPHFGVGISGGLSRINLRAIEPAVKLFYPDFPSGLSGAPLPSYAIEARVGGVILPFDVGVRFGIIPTTTLSSVTFNYLNVGGDIRYALLKDSLITPAVSVGAGVYYSQLGVGYTFTNAQLENFATYTGTSPDLTLAVTGKTLVVDFRAQVSKSLLIVTPYAGVGASLANSSTGFSLLGHTNTKKAENAFTTRVFGGASVNLVIFRMDLSGMYNFNTQNWGATFGTRVQL